MASEAALPKLVVLDFDGTVCLGDDPVLSYARHLDEALPAPRRVVEATVAQFLRGPDEQVAGLRSPAGLRSSAVTRAAHLDSVVDAADGYAAAATLATELGATPAQLGAAYEASRVELAEGRLETWAPEGVGEFLREIDAITVLVTNATATGVEAQLVHLGLDGVFDEVVTSAGKPAGMGPILTRLRAAHGLAEAPERLLSVGDIWRNDLAPAAEQGSVTALIERFAAAEAAPSYRAPTFEQLYAPLRAWAATA